MICKLDCFYILIASVIFLHVKKLVSSLFQTISPGGLHGCIFGWACFRDFTVASVNSNLQGNIILCNSNFKLEFELKNFLILFSNKCVCRCVCVCGGGGGGGGNLTPKEMQVGWWRRLQLLCRLKICGKKQNVNILKTNYCLNCCIFVRMYLYVSPIYNVRVIRRNVLGGH